MSLKTMQENYVVHHLQHNASNKRIRIHEMVHVAPNYFYTWKNRQFKEELVQGFELHHEGIKDTDRTSQRLKEAYANLASVLGWEAQAKPAFEVHNHDISWNQLNWVQKKVLSTLSGVLAFFVDSLLDMQKTSPEKAEETLKKLKDSVITGETKDSRVLKALNGLLITKRNRLAVESALATKNDVSLIWGKAHASDMIEQLQKQGYVYQR